MSTYKTLPIALTPELKKHYHDYVEAVKAWYGAWQQESLDPVVLAGLTKAMNEAYDRVSVPTATDAMHQGQMLRQVPTPAMFSAFMQVADTADAAVSRGDLTAEEAVEIAEDLKTTTETMVLNGLSPMPVDDSATLKEDGSITILVNYVPVYVLYPKSEQTS